MYTINIYVQYVACYVYYINIEQDLNVSFTLRKLELIERNHETLPQILIF